MGHPIEDAAPKDDTEIPDQNRPGMTCGLGLCGIHTSRIVDKRSVTGYGMV